ncbi:MAG: dynamin family protein [Thermodesulfovibrionia bacterium]|nr:dynamin family protein [Thermodesulfovibrionia bacterium]
MKETYSSVKDELININESLSSLLSDVRGRPDVADTRFEDWQNASSDIHRQVTEEVVHVAVIGTVKSGKSTFVNSLFRGDYLKRGAGIVTSIITRVRTGDRLKAVVFFKSWDEVNADIEQALVMFPSWDRQRSHKMFDIRREMDRQSIQSALEMLSEDTLITDGVRNANSVLLSLYLKGYDRVSSMISADSATTEFSGDRFAEHRIFVGDDALAVYLKDIKLEINSGNIDRSIEIADCQGSDSPNPHHLTMIQDYLMRTHLIVYVISSRTGLRQADIRLLSMIKKMGIMGNILFIVNTDFSEHESLEDLNNIVDKIREDLALIKPDPDVYVFSSLFNLFSVSSVSLMKRDSLRLAQWISEEDMASFATSETRRFESFLKIKLTQERFGLLLKNNLERMSIIVAGINHWIRMNRELLKKDVKDASASIRKMEHHQKRMIQIKSLIKNTLSGVTADSMKSLKADVDRFFSVYSGSVPGQTIEFVNNYTISVEKYREKLAASGFPDTLYMVFQQFKQSLDTFMAETINPEIARFSGEIEDRIKTTLESAAGPYYAMASDDITELKAAIGSLNMGNNALAGNRKSLLDMDVIKQVSGLTLPSTIAALQYSAKVRTEALMRLGLYSTITLFKRIIKKSRKSERDEQVRALVDGFKLIKRETEESVIFHFENYRENFKFQYVSRLVEAAADYLHRLLMERYQSYDTDLMTMEELIKKKGAEREDIIDFLDRVAFDAQHLQETVDKCRVAIEQ